MKAPTRQRIVWFVVGGVCLSLLLLYNSTTNTPEYQNNSNGRQMGDIGQHTSSLEGYSSLIDRKPLRMHCKCCALVTSSGHMTGSNRGAEIDNTECVIRMNDAPTRGYEHDVGRRTSLRVVAHSSMQRVLRNRLELLNSSLETFFIFWGPGNYMRGDGKGLVYNHLRLMKQRMPELQVYIISREQMLHFDELFKKETGKDRSSNSKPSVPYHYYEPAGPDECTMYLSHEQGRHGSHHRFITEKRVFANWARMFNIHFYQPDWRPAALPENHTFT
ncbi:alpha-N-acetylgalactosaminide alpha-2,6-sialyltransferase 5b isoform X4 [Triplophysa dalaica]|uniref:alpha-N-acetylgalactosaminide alpha-2,6-sialyltransferase 5b isoform X4 n=1 Tax=Triplophysa dalaica TaxID=1582913 RepID=UPI0024E02ED8|nr:alpha-N-acetylgalactosaminide alpha-2,6-sialyltransferase 5b isoform X4 [Triplophysa dalaica]